MALDYSASTPHGLLAGAIDEAELPYVLPAFDLLTEKTGVSIDPFGSSRLDPDHARLLLEILPEVRQPGLQCFRQALQAAIDHNVVLHFSGD